MSKVGNIAAGLLGGYVGYKQQKEAREERKEDREMMQAILGKKKDDDTASTTAKNAMVSGAAAGDAVSSLSSSDVANRAAQSGFVSSPEDEVVGAANGGMVGELPKQYDRFGWQRQSFKKGTPSF